MNNKRKNEDPVDIQSLDIDGVKKFLSKVLNSTLDPNFVKNLEDNNIDGEVLLLPDFSKQYLIELGLTKKGDQSKILNAINQQKQDSHPTKKIRTETESSGIAANGSSQSKTQGQILVDSESDSDDSFVNPNFEKRSKKKTYNVKKKK